MKPLFLILLVASLLVMLSPLGKAIQDKSLVLYLPFDEENEGKALDKSGNSNDAILHNARLVEGKIKKAVEFMGKTGSYAEVFNSPSVSFTSAITGEAWIKIKGHKDWQRVFAKGFDYFVSALASDWGGCGNCKYYPAITPSDGDCCLQASGDQLRGETIELQVDTWTHLAMTYDGKKLNFYVNGALNIPVDALGQEIKVSTEPLKIGGLNGETEFFNGAIDEVAFYSRALTEKEIKQDMKGVISAVSQKEKLTITWGSIK